MKQIFAFALLLCSGHIFSQIYIAGQRMPSDNFYQIKDYINTHLRKTTGMTHDEQASEGDHLYDRWIDYWQDHVNPDGSFPAPDHTYQEMLRYRQTHPAPASRSTGHHADWHQVAVTFGPDAPGIGRVDRIDFNSTNPAHLYLSSPSGSFWESLDGGTTWRSRTDQLPIIGTSGIIVDPNDTNTIYLATGDGEANMDNPSIGVLKSRDGGSTWAPTGLSFTFTTGQKYISRIQMNPTDPSQLLVAASDGVYRTQDSGVTWTNVLLGNFRDVRYMYHNGAVCYASADSTFYRSVDAGRTWQQIVTGNPGTSDRTTIAVTRAAPARVYLLAGGPNGLVGVYMSIDTGKTWTTQATTPNILGYAVDGSDFFSQSWYTCTLSASPLDSDLLYAGGANVWRSTDAGVTWTCQTSIYDSGYAPVHPDIHELHFSDSGTTLYIGCDGGIYTHDLSSSVWPYTGDGLQNTQVYRIAVSEGDTNIVMYGAQDNDVVVGYAGAWDGNNLDADGFGCAIDPTNSNNLYGSSQYGGINNSYDRGQTWIPLSIGNQSANWDAPYKMNLLTPTELFAGLDNFYHSTDGGSSWVQLGSLGNGGDVFNAFGYSESNTRIIYASAYSYQGANGSSVYKSVDGGASWTNLNYYYLSGLIITAIEVSPYDPNKVWLTVGGYNAGKKVFYTSDGGVTFANISGSLPDLSCNTVVYQKGSNNVVYVGMDDGVYVRGDTLHDWTLFADNLPNAIVKELKIRYATNELFAGTYGRGVWHTKLYQQENYLAVNDISASPDIIVYPNPVSDALIIETSDGMTGEASITISTATGQQIKQLQTAEAKVSVSCADLAPGIYFVYYELGATRTVRKFVKL